MQEIYRHNLSIIHQIDARVKIIFTLAFILFLSLTPSGAWPAYILFLSLIISVTLYSRLGIGFVLKRTLFAIPFILAAFPLIFTGHPPFITVSVFQRIQLTVSPEGFARFVSIAIKSWISIQAAIVLAATTRFPDLLIALKQLKVPTLFVSIIGLMWRYMFVISDEAARMLRARASRSAAAPGTQHAGGTLFWRARVTGGMAGSLFLRALERSDRVYAAMSSRGYNGEPVAIDPVAMNRRDYRILLVGLFTLSIILLFGLLFN